MWEMLAALSYGWPYSVGVNERQALGDPEVYCPSLQHLPNVTKYKCPLAFPHLVPAAGDVEGSCETFRRWNELEEVLAEGKRDLRVYSLPCFLSSSLPALQSLLTKMDWIHRDCEPELTLPPVSHFLLGIWSQQ